jgi:nucleotide-binding universal stress UspA family protein
MRRRPVPFAGRILIPTDGSPEAIAASRVGLGLARALGGSVRAVSLVDRQILYGPGTLAAAGIRPGLQAELERDTHSALAAVAARARELKVPCVAMVREGFVLDAILAETRRARGRMVRAKLGDVRLRFGDTLLVLGPRESLRHLVADPDFLVLEEVERPILRAHKAPLALAVAGLVILLAALEVVRSWSGR